MSHSRSIQVVQDLALRQLLQAIETLDQEGVLAALAAGTPVDIVDDSTEEGGLTPLQLAAAGGNLAALTVLLQHGADPGNVNRQGETALYLGALYGHSTIVEALSPLVDEEVEGPGSRTREGGSQAARAEAVRILRAARRLLHGPQSGRHRRS